jgi:hypothetical protein
VIFRILFRPIEAKAVYLERGNQKYAENSDGDVFVNKKLGKRIILKWILEE